MSKFFLSGETCRVSFPDGEWIDIKQELSQADLDYIMSQMMQTRIATNGKDKPEAKVDMTFGRLATLERSIVAWSFTEDGRAIPVTSDNISNLRMRYRSKALAEIDRLAQETSEFAKN